MKREINELLADVWGTMLEEKLAIIDNKIEKEEDMDKLRILQARKSGMIEALVLFSMLETGRYKTRFDSIKASIEAEKEKVIWTPNLSLLETLVIENSKDIFMMNLILYFSNEEGFLLLDRLDLNLLNSLLKSQDLRSDFSRFEFKDFNDLKMKNPEMFALSVFMNPDHQVTKIKIGLNKEYFAKTVITNNKKPGSIQEAFSGEQKEIESLKSVLFSGLVFFSDANVS